MGNQPPTTEKYEDDERLMKRRESFRGVPVTFAEAYSLAIIDGWSLAKVEATTAPQLRAAHFFMPPPRHQSTNGSPPELPSRLVFQAFLETIPSTDELLLVPSIFYRYYLCNKPTHC